MILYKSDISSNGTSAVDIKTIRSAVTKKYVLGIRFPII